jgi:hypothetical protein
VTPTRHPVSAKDLATMAKRPGRTFNVKSGESIAMAIPPRTMIKMMASGVSHARMFVCKALALVKNGDPCASANCMNR